MKTRYCHLPRLTGVDALRLDERGVPAAYRYFAGRGHFGKMVITDA
ncbi:hypothetical protein [Streptomyces iranensis]